MADRKCSIKIIKADPKIHSVPLLTMIKKLNEFEGSAKDDRKSFEDSLEILRSDMENGHFQCLIAQNESIGTAAGYVLYCFGYSTWGGLSRTIHLQDIFVEEEARRLGVGTALFKELARICQQEKLSSIQWGVLGWNKKAQEFYTSLGAENLTETEGSLTFLLSPDAISKLVSDQ